MHCSFIYGGLFILLSVSPGAFSQPIDQSIPMKMDTIFKRYLQTKGPGCSVAVLQTSQVVFAKNYGLANLDYQEPVTSASLFDLASVTKQFTGLAISTLIQQGKLSLTDDIRTYLPQVPNFGNVITLNDLVHHTSGLRDYPEALMMAGWRYSELCTLDDVIQFVTRQKELDYAPRTTYRYCNTNYVLLALLIEKVTGESFPTWIKNHIFAPLGMTSSFILENSNTVMPGLATSYTPTEHGYLKRPDLLTAYGSSCMYSTMDDLVKWVVHFQKQLQRNDPVYRRMLAGSVLTDGTRVSYGFGLERDTYSGLPVIYHTGAWSGYRTVIIHYPAQEFAIIILGNANDDKISGQYVREVAGLFLNEQFQTNVASLARLKALPDVVLPTSVLQKYSGTFSPDGSRSISYRVDNGQLIGQNGRVRFTLQAKNDSCFYSPSDDGMITFLSNGGNLANAFIFSNSSISVRSTRVTGLVKKSANFSPTVTQLNLYTGSFYSAELETLYGLSLKNDKLMIHHFRRGDFALTPNKETQHEFRSDIGTFTFYMTKENRVSGFLLSGDSVRNMRFKKH